MTSMEKQTKILKLLEKDADEAFLNYAQAEEKEAQLIKALNELRVTLRCLRYRVLDTKSKLIARRKEYNYYQ